MSRTAVVVGGAVVAVGLITVAVVVGIFAVMAKRDLAPTVPVSVRYAVESVPEGTAVTASVTAVEGELPADLTVPTTEVEPAYLRTNPTADEEQVPGAKSGRQRIEVTPTGPTTAEVRYVVSPRPEGRRTVVLSTPFEGTQQVEVTAEVTGQVTSCLVPTRNANQSGRQRVWVEPCAEGLTASTFRATTKDVPDNGRLVGWLRLVLAPPQ